MVTWTALKAYLKACYVDKLACWASVKRQGLEGKALNLFKGSN